METPLRAGVLAAPFVMLFLVFVAGWTGYGPALSEGASAGLAWLMQTLGWAFSLIGIGVIVAAILVAALLGNVRIGGDEARPSHGSFAAIAIGVGASTSLGLLFWASAEPLYHLYQPPQTLGIPPLGIEAQVFARVATMLHWAVIVGLANALCLAVFGLTVHNAGRRPTLDGVVFRGERPRPIGAVLDGFLVFFATLMTVGAFASCIVALSSEMTRFGPRAPNPAALFAIALAMVFVIFVTGARPIRTVYSLMARAALVLMIGMMAATLVIGPSGAILGGAVRAMWQMIWSVPSLLGFTGLSSADPWPQTWTMTHWGNVMLLAPLVGLFLSRAAKGFRVAEAVMLFAILPAVITMLWILVFGGLAISVDQRTGGALWAAIARGGADDAAYAALSSLPGGESLMVGFVMLIALAFATFASAMLHAVMRICAPGAEDDPTTGAARASVATAWCAGLGIAGWGLASYGVGPIVDTIARLGSLPALIIAIGFIIAALRLCLRPSGLNTPAKREPVQIDFDLGEMIANDFDDDDGEPALPRRKRRRKNA